MALYALNLFDLSENDLYRQYSRRSVAAAEEHGGKLVALGRLADVVQTEPGVEPRTVMALSNGLRAGRSMPSSKIPHTRTSTRFAKTGRETQPSRRTLFPAWWRMP